MRGVYEPRRGRRPGRPRRRCLASPAPGASRPAPRPPCRPLSFRAQPRGARNLVPAGRRPVRRLRSVYAQCTLAPMFPQPEVPMPAPWFALFPPLLALLLPPFTSRRPGVFEEPALSLSKGIPPCPAVPQFPPNNALPRSHPSYPRRRVCTPTARAPASRLQSAPPRLKSFLEKTLTRATPPRTARPGTRSRRRQIVPADPDAHPCHAGAAYRPAGASPCHSERSAAARGIPSPPAPRPNRPGPLDPPSVAPPPVPSQPESAPPRHPAYPPPHPSCLPRHPSYPRRRVSTPTAHAPESRPQTAPPRAKSFLEKTLNAHEPAPFRTPGGPTVAPQAPA